jgi:hypothetical protein
MPSRRPFRTAALVLCVCLVASIASASGGGADPSRSIWESLVQAWERVTSSLWQPTHADEGCTIDPNGGHCPPRTSTDAGCTVDPDGRCRS